MPKVFVAGRLVARPDDLDDVLAVLTALVDHARGDEPGTEQYILMQNMAEPHEL